MLGLLLCAYANTEPGPTDAPVEVSPLTSMLNGLPAISITTAVLFAILRPATFRWSWGRVLAALAVVVPWVTVNALGSPGWHAGWQYALGLWLYCVTAILLVVLVASLIRPLFLRVP